jgi:hypothetical protein
VPLPELAAEFSDVALRPAGPATVWSVGDGRLFQHSEGGNSAVKLCEAFRCGWEGWEGWEWLMKMCQNGSTFCKAVEFFSDDFSPLSSWGDFDRAADPFGEFIPISLGPCTNFALNTLW